MANKTLVLLFLMAILFIPMISANTFGYNYLDNKDNILEGANYSINVNNTEFHRGLTPQQVANLFDASSYYLKSNPFGFYNSTTLPAQTDYNSTGLILNWSKLIQWTNILNKPAWVDDIEYNGSVEYDATDYGYALELNGVNQYGYRGTASSEYSSLVTKDVTLSAWVKPNEVNYGNGGIGGIEGTWALLFIDSGKVRFNLRIAGSAWGNDLFEGTGIITAGSWYHIVATYNGTHQRIYINGTLDAERNPAVNGNLDYGYGRTFGIGVLDATGTSGVQASGPILNGTIDQVLVWNRSLNATEVATLYNSGSGLFANISVAPFSTGLVSGWNMDEGTGTSLADISGLGKTATLVNTPTWVTGKVSTGGNIVAYTNSTYTFYDNEGNLSVLVAKGYETGTPKDLLSSEDKVSELDYLLDKYEKNLTLSKEGVLKEVPQIAKAKFGGSWSVDGMVHWLYQEVLNIILENKKQDALILQLQNNITALSNRISKLENVKL